MCMRAFDLFRTTIDTLALHDNRFDQFLSWTRFHHWFRENMFIMKRSHVEDAD